MRLAARALALALLTVTAPGALAKPKRLAAPKPVLHAAKERGEDAPPAPPGSDALLQKLASAKLFAGGRLGVAVLDLESNRLLHAHAHDVALNPASNAKLLTAAAALGTLGGAHAFLTTVSGALEGGVVEGPLVLRGHGDPSLSTADVAELVERLLQKGVRAVKGGVVVDQGYFDESFVPPAFEQQEHEWAPFRASTAAVSLDENTMTLVIEAAEKGKAAIVRVEPEGAAEIEGAITCDSAKGDSPQVALTVESGVTKARLAGSIRPGTHTLRYVKRAHDPRLLAGRTLKRLLARAGVRVDGDVALGSAPEKRVLAEHLSAPLASLLLRVGKQSDNFYAEMIFRALDAEAKGKGGSAAGAASAVQAFMARIGVADEGLLVKNGSGLFDANRVSPHTFVKLLAWAWREPSVHPEFLAQLAVGGVDGTLRARFDEPQLRGRIRAKTGTLEHVASLAGYILRADGRAPVVFALVANGVNDVPGARMAFDAFVRGVAAQVDAGGEAKVEPRTADGEAGVAPGADLAR
jgi:D-alanyl-D-alanine carboxypeptidase/D-alanyl-D-alanine-endopeptidase (penicillin-binding protein 4)